MPESFARAYSVMMTEPRGPVYMCYDAWLQEKKLDHDVAAAAEDVPGGALAAGTRSGRAGEGRGHVGRGAKRPVILAEYAGRDPAGFHALVELAETLGAPVYDLNVRLNFPSRHPLNLSMSKAIFREADVVLCVDVRDWETPDHRARRARRASSSR